MIKFNAHPSPVENVTGKIYPVDGDDFRAGYGRNESLVGLEITYCGYSALVGGEAADDAPDMIVIGALIRRVIALFTAVGVELPIISWGEVREDRDEQKNE